jgi:hypothetical protein
MKPHDTISQAATLPMWARKLPNIAASLSDGGVWLKSLWWNDLELLKSTSAIQAFIPDPSKESIVWIRGHISDESHIQG